MALGGDKYCIVRRRAGEKKPVHLDNIHPGGDINRQFVAPIWLAPLFMQLPDNLLNAKDEKAIFAVDCHNAAPEVIILFIPRCAQGIFS